MRNPLLGQFDGSEPTYGGDGSLSRICGLGRDGYSETNVL